MKKTALILVFALLVTAYAFAQLPVKPKVAPAREKTETTAEKKTEAKKESKEEAKPVLFDSKKMGVRFMVPAGFANAINTDMSQSWNGPKKGEMIWSLHLNVTPIPQGVGAKQMHDINFKSDKDNKTTYKEAKPIKVNGAVAAYMFKEIDKPAGEHYRWYVRAFSKKNMYLWNFCGSEPSFKEYGPIIMDTVKTIKIK